MTTHEELKSAIAFLQDPSEPIAIEMYLVMKGSPDLELKKANMDPALARGLQLRVLSHVQEEVFDDTKKVYGPMSEADDYTKALCYYDLGGIPDELAFFVTASNKPVVDDFEHGIDDLSKIFGYVFRIGSDGKYVTLFKKHLPFDTIQRGKTFLIVPSKTRMEQLQVDAIKVSGDFDLMLVQGNLIVLNIGLMESTFKVDRLIRDKAAAKLKEIERAGILKDTTKLSKELEKLPVARKLNKASRTSTVLQLPKKTIAEFITGHNTLKDDLPVDAGSHQIELTTIDHVKEFLRLLDDDFLRSDLTNEQYLALVKQRLDKKKGKAGAA